MVKSPNIKLPINEHYLNKTQLTFHFSLEFQKFFSITRIIFSHSNKIQFLRYILLDHFQDLNFRLGIQTKVSNQNYLGNPTKTANFWLNYQKSATYSENDQFSKLELKFKFWKLSNIRDLDFYFVSHGYWLFEWVKIIHLSWQILGANSIWHSDKNLIWVKWCVKSWKDWKYSHSHRMRNKWQILQQNWASIKVQKFWVCFGKM